MGASGGVGRGEIARFIAAADEHRWAAGFGCACSTDCGGAGCSLSGGTTSISTPAPFRVDEGVIE
ncbi:MAG: hypothetical protein R2705_01075 [Ilumatobacteraceae bacterium]